MSKFYILLIVAISTFLPLHLESGEPNAVTPSEAAAGWVNLFDGESPRGWRGYKKDGFPTQGWSVEDGWLRVIKAGGGGDIVTIDRFDDFILELEWKSAEGANSGIMYLTNENNYAPYQSAPEYQLLDSSVKTNPSESAGSLFGLYAPTNKKQNPAGEINHTRIVHCAGYVEHWLNGVRVLTAEIGSIDWNHRVKNSKFAAWKDFGTVKKGHICLQDHNDSDLWFRSIKIREIPATERWRFTGEGELLFNGRNLDGWDSFPYKLAESSDGNQKESVELVYAVSMENVAPENHSTALQQTSEAIAKRIKDSGFSTAEVDHQADNQLRILLPNCTQAERDQIKQLIRQNGRISFHLVASESDQSDANIAKAEKDYLEYENAQKIYQGLSKEERAATPEPALPDLIVVERPDPESTVAARNIVLANTPKKSLRLPIFNQVQPTTNAFGQPALGIELAEKSARQMGELTENHVNEELAVVIDGKAKLIATINARISNQMVVDSDLFTHKEVQNLANLFHSSPTPSNLFLIHERKVEEPAMNKDSVWSVKDGILTCKGTPAGYIYTQKDYQDFVLELDWRWDPVTKKEGNSGVLFRKIGEHKVWPRSIEAQLMSKNAGDFWNIDKFVMTADPDRTNGRNTKKTEMAEYPVGEWNRYEIHCIGGDVTLIVNGKVVNKATGCEQVAGPICLQSEGTPIQFRDIRIHAP